MLVVEGNCELRVRTRTMFLLPRDSYYTDFPSYTLTGQHEKNICG